MQQAAKSGESVLSDEAADASRTLLRWADKVAELLAMIETIRAQIRDLRDDAPSQQRVVVTVGHAPRVARRDADEHVESPRRD